MKEKTYQKIKDELPVIVTAAAVSLLSYVLYFAGSRSILDTVKSTFLVIFYSGLAVALVYLVIWVEYRVTNRRRRKIGLFSW